MSETAKGKSKQRRDRGHIYWYLSYDKGTGHLSRIGTAWKVFSARERGDAFDNRHWESDNYFTDLDAAREEAHRRNLLEMEKEEPKPKIPPKQDLRKIESEKAVEKYLVNRCMEQGWTPLKYSSGIKTGYPDRCILTPGGLTVWVEVKTTGEKPTQLQKLRIFELQELGYMVRIVDSRECVDVLVNIIKLKLDGIPTA